MYLLRNSKHVIIMKQIYLERIPHFYKEINENNSLCLTGDMDSLLSSMLLQQLFGCKISRFFDSTFENIYKVNDPIESDKEVIGVDLSLTGTEKTFSNHCIRPIQHYQTNPNDINLNNLFDVYGNHNIQYHKKFAGSTLVTLFGLYNVDISKLSEIGKMITLCIDSMFLGYFSKYPNDQYSCKFFLCDVLELTELYKTLERHTKEEFIGVQNRLKLKSPIYINENGNLETECNLFLLSLELGFSIFDWIELPKQKFIHHKTYKTGYGTLATIKKMIEDNKKIISLSVISKSYSAFSYVD